MHLVKMQMSGNRTYTREGEQKCSLLGNMAQIFRLKKRYVPGRAGWVGNSVKDPVNSFSTVKSKPAVICFVEAGNEGTQGLTVLHLLCFAAPRALGRFDKLTGYLECWIQVKGTLCTLCWGNNRAFPARKFSSQWLKTATLLSHEWLNLNDLLNAATTGSLCGRKHKTQRQLFVPQFPLKLENLLTLKALKNAALV